MPNPTRQTSILASRYVAQDGRVIDTGNANVSHSEGQGWGLMAAQACDDPLIFARILTWTTRTLQCRPYDRLHVWRYRPTDTIPVADINNATDGDLYIAAALAGSAICWNRPDYAVAAAGIAKAILGLGRKAGLAAAPMLSAFEQYWTASRPMPPAWVALNSGEVAPYPAPVGMLAVASFVSESYQGATISIPSVKLAAEYYSAGLVLLSRIASRQLDRPNGGLLR